MTYLAAPVFAHVPLATAASSNVLPSALRRISYDAMLPLIVVPVPSCRGTYCTRTHDQVVFVQSCSVADWRVARACATRAGVYMFTGTERQTATDGERQG